jgi:predicted MPP superfamily phosphohydrolase
VAIPALAAVAGVVGWGIYEAGRVRLEEVPLPLPGLPPELDGLRIAHLSDFHLGMPSRGELAVERAVEWAAARRPDLVVITGDLLTRPRAEPRLRKLLERLPSCYVVLGNHDVGDAGDPFSAPTALSDLSPAVLLRDEAATVPIRGRRVQIVGVDPRSYRRGTSHPESLADPEADLRILLCHFPVVVERLRPGVFHLVLAGHLHAGQINLPYGSGTLRFGDLRLLGRSWRFVRGVYRRPAATLHVSAGLGTSFVPLRLFARPEATELVLQSG